MSSLLVTPAQNRPTRSRSSSISSVGSTSSFASSLRQASLSVGNAVVSAAEAGAEAARGRGTATPEVRRRASSTKAAQWEHPEDRGGSLIASMGGAALPQRGSSARPSTPTRRPASPGGVQVITSPKGVTVAAVSMGGGYTPSMGSRLRREGSQTRQAGGASTAAGSQRPRSASAATATRTVSRTGAAVAPATPDFRQKVASRAASDAGTASSAVASASRRERPWRLGRPSSAAAGATFIGDGYEPTVEVYAPFSRPAFTSNTAYSGPAIVPVSAARDVLADISAVLDQIGGMGTSTTTTTATPSQQPQHRPVMVGSRAGWPQGPDSRETLLSGLAHARALHSSGALTSRRRTGVAPPLGPYPAATPAAPPRSPSPERPFEALSVPASAAVPTQPVESAPPSPPPVATPFTMPSSSLPVPLSSVSSSLHSEAARLRQTIRLRQLEEVLRGYHKDIAVARAAEAAGGSSDTEGAVFGRGTDGVGVATLLSAAEACLREVNAVRGGLGLSPIKAAVALGGAAPFSPQAVTTSTVPSSSASPTRGRAATPVRPSSPTPTSLLTYSHTRARQEQSEGRGRSSRSPSPRRLLASPLVEVAPTPAPPQQVPQSISSSSNTTTDLVQALSPWTSADATITEASSIAAAAALQWPSPPLQPPSPRAPSPARGHAARSTSPPPPSFSSPPRHHPDHPLSSTLIVLSAAPPSKVYQRMSSSSSSSSSLSSSTNLMTSSGPGNWDARMHAPSSPQSTVSVPPPAVSEQAPATTGSTAIAASRGALARVARAAAAKAACGTSTGDATGSNTTTVASFADAKRSVPANKPAIRFAPGSAAEEGAAEAVTDASSSPRPSSPRKKRKATGEERPASPRRTRSPPPSTPRTGDGSAKAALASLLHHGAVVAEDKARFAAAAAPPLAERAVLMEQEQQLHAMGTLGPWEATPPLLAADGVQGSSSGRVFSSRDEARVVLAQLPPSVRTLLPIPDTITSQRLSQTLALTATSRKASKETRRTVSPARAAVVTPAATARERSPSPARAVAAASPAPSLTDALRATGFLPAASAAATPAPAAIFRGLDGAVWPSYVPESWRLRSTVTSAPASAAAVSAASLQFARPPGDAPARHVDTLADIARQRDADAAALRAKNVAAAALLALPSPVAAAQPSSLSSSSAAFPALDRLASEGRKRAAAAAAAAASATPH